MSRVRQMIELFAPPVMREGRPEKFTVKGFTCPECHGNGWHWDVDFSGMCEVKEPCRACNGTGMVDAEVAVHWQPSEERSKV